MTLDWGQHNLSKVNGQWECDRCQWTWDNKPVSKCPGLPRYSWRTKPDNLLTKTQLGEQGLKLSPNQPERGCVQSGDNKKWWLLYDKAEAQAKQKKSAAVRSTRPLCPIGIDCLLVAAERGRPCPNKDYCAAQARPWKLPYQICRLQDGTCVLEVTLSYYTETERLEKQAVGFHESVRLPYTYLKDDEGQPVLCVVYCTNNEQKAAGWFNPESLPDSYWMWAAVKLGMNYKDFREYEWSKDCWSDWMQRREHFYSEGNLPEFPHCVLLQFHIRNC